MGRPQTPGMAIDALHAAATELNACVERCRLYGISAAVYVDGNYRVSLWIGGDLESLSTTDVPQKDGADV